MNTIDRREALQRVALLLGSTISTPTLIALLEGCQPKTKTAEQTVTATKPSISDNQQKMIAEISEIIIPTTSTPGAKAAKVPEFIALMLVDCYTEDDQKSFIAGLDQLEDDAKKSYNNAFLACKPEEQVALLKKAESAAMATREKDRQAREKNPNAKDQPKATLLFFPTMKELTLVGYFTSEIGATQALEYVPVPTRYEGCIDLKPGQKAWAT